MRPSDPRNPSQSLTFLIHDVARMVRRNFARRASGLGLTQASGRRWPISPSGRASARRRSPT